MSGLIKGFHIWNKAWENRAIFQKHSFWEIRDGILAWFWEDNWQHEPKLLREGFANLKNDTDKKGLLRVSDLWDQERSKGKWRIWKNLVHSDDSPLKAHAEALTTILEQRKILTLADSNQLRWGKSNEGNFNLKEAKLIALGLDFPNPDWTNKQGQHYQSLKKWRRNFSDNEIINKTWALVPDFLIWDVWKEHKNKIFKSRKGSSQNIMAQILRQLKETVGTLIKNPPEDQPKDTDVHILLHLGLQGLVPQGKNMNVSHIIIDKDFWQPPPQGFMKCNIDGASKGNPGMAGYGGVIRDQKGFIKTIFHSHLGKATNNGRAHGP
eukprot:PITA_03217